MEGNDRDGEDDSVGSATIPVRSSSRVNKAVPPSRYGYEDDGKKTAPPKSSKSKKTVSAISSLSIASQRKTIELENEDELNRLEIAHEEKIEGIKIKITAKRRNIHQLKADLDKKKAHFPQINDQEASSKLSSEIADLETLINLREPEVEDLLEEIASTTRIYEKKRSVIKRSLEIEKEKLQLLQNVQEEQDLDSEEERQVEEWDQQQNEMTHKIPEMISTQVEEEDEESQSISSHRSHHSQLNPNPAVASTSRPQVDLLTNIERPTPYYDKDGAFVYPLNPREKKVIQRKQVEIAIQNARQRQKQAPTNPPNYQRRSTPTQQRISPSLNRNGENIYRNAPPLMSLHNGNETTPRSQRRPLAPPPPPTGINHNHAVLNTEVIPAIQPQTGYRLPHHRQSQHHNFRQNPGQFPAQSFNYNHHYPQHSRNYLSASPNPSACQNGVQPQNSTEALLQQMTSSLTAALTSAMGHKSRPLPPFNGNASDWSYWLNSFEATYKNYSVADNIARIANSLGEKPNELVKHYYINATQTNLDKIVDILWRTYGSPEVLLDSLIKKAKEVKAVELEKPYTVIKFGTAVDVLTTNIISFNQLNFLHDHSILSELVKKLPSYLQHQWYWQVMQSSHPLNINDFNSFIQPTVDIARMQFTPYQEESNVKRGKKFSVCAAAEIQPKPEEKGSKPDTAKLCFYCEKGAHSIRKCFSFKKLTLKEKWEFVKTKRLCFKCFADVHDKEKCEKPNCKIDSCGKPHNPILHYSKRESAHFAQEESSDDESEGEQELEEPDSSTPPPEQITTAKNKSSLPVIRVKIFGPKGSEIVYALLDTGSTITLLDKELAERCGISGEPQPLLFSQFKGKVTEDSENVSISIQGTQRNAKKFKIANVRTTSHLQMTAGGFDMESLKSTHPHLQEAKCKSLPLIKPQILLGSNSYQLFRAQDSYEGDNLEGPAAYYSHLGWYLVPEGDTEFCHFLQDSDRLEYDRLLHQEVKNFFSTENFGVAIVPNSEKSKDDKRALQLLEENTKFKNGRWTTQLLWKDEKPQLPPSKGMALNRLRSMEKKMDKDPAFAKLVVSKFEDYMAKGYLIKKKDVDKRLLKIIEVDNAHKKWYLPWFFAYHPTKKPRLVIDAAAKSNGKCYNDFFLKGPDLLNPLQAVLMQFRQFNIPFTADVQEMFHRVLVALCDWAAQTILYRGMDRNSEPEEYYIPVLFFGSIHSPASAIFALQQNAKRFKDQFPLAVFLILLQIYMDDLLAGGSSVEEAAKLVKEIDFIHSEGGFNLTKWSSSIPEVLASIPEERRAHGEAEFHQKGEIVTDKTLGLWWDPKEDNFVFKINLHRVPKEVISGERRPTKRELTSAIMSLFDPIGFLAPLKIKALILMQDVWRSGVDWDDEVPSKIEAKWREWIKILPNVEKLKIRRNLKGLSGGADSTLHVFCDASEEAFACAAYLVSQTGGRKIAEFVAGRARVAPLKSLTVPRLELQAAVMGSRLACKIKDLHIKELPQLSFVMWSDSKCVLKQIRSSTLRYKVFQSNRIGEITELTDVSSWRWVPSKLNVADDATRSDMESCEISQNSRWLSQPEFLLEDKDKWPKEEKLVITEDDHEDMGLKVLFAAEEDEDETLPIPNFRNLSTWNRLLRAAAAVRVAARKFRDKKSPYKITIEDLEWAEVMLIKRAQLDKYADEISKLEKNEKISSKSKIFALSPTLNPNGLIVLGGRIDKTPGVREEVKRPPILDPTHKLTKMLIVHHHEKGSHHGQERVLNELRQKVWIVGARAAVRSCWANCKECKLRVGKPVIPMMGQLPLGRLEGYQYPFQNCGVDFFGPILCTQRRSQVKRWGVIFTCLATRAIHLDLAEGLDASEMINALVRFSSIRNTPAKIYSDNGKNFQGGNREMKEEFQKLLKGNIRELSSVKGIEWHFNPPLGSHFGGVFERMIGSVKRCLAFSLKTSHPKESILRTLLCEITNIVNSRPLTYVSSDPADPECLTPNHFLKLKAMPQQTIPGEYAEENYRQGWKYVQQLADAFWKRWVTEYVPTLARREKWHKPTTPLKVGDLVLVVDELSPRSGWKKGLVIKTYPAKDGQVRFVDIRVAVAKKDEKGELKVTFVEYKRPVVKIIPLGLDDVA